MDDNAEGALMTAEIARGNSSNAMRVATCKDCQREIAGLERQIAKARSEGRDIQVLEKQLDQKKRSAGQFSYSEHSADGILDRGGSRSDRCPEHRRRQRTNTAGIAVPYVELQTIGEAPGARKPEGPTGPFGGLGPLPAPHKKEDHTAKLAEYEFGMTDVDIVGILELLRDHRVLVLRAGTGTGKSTFGPYRLMDPPTKAKLEQMGLMEQVTKELEKFGLPPLQGDPYRLTDLGPIVVTEPRVAAATGVSQFVGEKLAMGCKLKQCANPTHGLLLFNPKAHTDEGDGLTGESCPDYGKKDAGGKPTCTREHVGQHPGYTDDAMLPKACVVADCSQHIGPGFPVGYQAKGVRHWDDSCQLVFATDGAVINWLRDGRLNRIGTVIVDEAHERSTNIDFIMGYLKRDLAKYPHLRVIITSATFEPKFYEEYFGQFHPGLVAVKDVPSVKTVGYGLPLFPDLDLNTDEMRAYLASPVGEDAPPHAWPEQDRWPLVDEVEPDVQRILDKHWATRSAPPLKENEVRDPREAKGGEHEYIEDLWETTRKLLPLRLDPKKVIADTKEWRDKMPDLVAEFVIDLEAGLREADIFGDILAFLPTERKINEAVDRIKAAVGADVDVLPLISKLSEAQVDEALAARRKGDRRKIVVSTNLAETSLTVEGVRFVVDSGLIAQSDWKPELAAGGVGTTLHSQSGIKQRWGRVGRKAPGWVFPLYTKRQFSELPEDTPPGSARENLEQLMMTARLGGIDDVLNFPWPAAFLPESVTLDAAAQKAQKTFVRERDRADAALRSSGAVTEEGYPTALGKELTKFSELGSSAAAMAVLYADRLGCVPEVVTILKLLDGQRLVGSDSLFLDDRTWPDEWRVEAYTRHRGLMSLAEDDAHLALIVCAAWEQADPDPKNAPWVPSKLRSAWCRQWFVSNEVLVNAAKERQKVLELLSPKMKKEVMRAVKPALLDRARGVLARTMRATEFRLDGDAYVPLEIPPRLKPDGTADTSPTRFAVESDSVMTERPTRILALRRRENKDAESFISGLIKLPGHAPERAEHTGSSAADAMAMIVEFKEKAPVDELRDVALTLLKDWPIGQRVRLTETDRDLAAQQLKVDVPVIPPFAKPLLTDVEFELEGVSRRRGKRSHKGRSADDEDSYDANSSDSSGDFAKRRVRGADEDFDAERAFARGEQEIGSADRAADEDGEPCGRCTLCRDGKPQHCLTLKKQRKQREAALAESKDALAEHQREFEELRTRTLAALTLEFDGNDEPRIFEVIEYRDGATGQPKVVLAPDWRADGADADPSKHQGVRPGQRIEVVVAGRVRDHKDELCVFQRSDGQGRFLLREANASLAKQVERGVIAASLSAGATGLLGMLEPGQSFTATVVPGRADGTFTITTLQMLHQHLRRGTQGRQHFDAVVHAPEDKNGFLTFRLLHSDRKRGIHHLISYNPSRAKSGDTVDPLVDEDTASTAIPDPRWAVGTAHKVALALDTGGSLDVAGKDLEALRDLTRDPANGVLMPRRAGGKDPKVDDENGDGDSRVSYTTETGAEPSESAGVLASPGTKIVIRRDHGNPISSKVAEVLADLDPDDAEWQSKVWSFWARSFHIKVDSNEEILPGDASESVDAPLEAVEFDDELPSAVADREFEAYAQANSEPRRVTGIVTRVDEYSATLDIGEPFDGRLHVSNIAHARVDRADNVIRRGDEITAEVSQYDTRYRRVEVSTQVLLPTAFARFKAAFESRTDQEKTQPVTGIVENIDKGFVWVNLGGGVDGNISFKELSHEFIDSPSDHIDPGHELRARILGFDDGRKKVNLSIKAMYLSQWGYLAQQLKRGVLVRGRIVRYAEKKDVPGKPFGIIVEVLPGVGGMVHVKEMPGFIPDIRASFPLGHIVQARVLSVDQQKKSISLSLINNAGTPTVVSAWTPPPLSWPAPSSGDAETASPDSVRNDLIASGLLRPAKDAPTDEVEAPAKQEVADIRFSGVRTAAVSSAGDGHAEMWVVLDTGEIHNRWWIADENKWSSWAHDRLPDQARATVIAGGSHGNWSHDLLAVDSHGALWHRSWSTSRNAWNDWRHQEMPHKAVHCEVSSAGPNHSELWAVLDTGDIYHCWWIADENKWSSWAHDRLPDQARATVIAGGSHGNWSHDLLAVDSHGALWHRSWSTSRNAWNDWRHVA
jgi:HrpA-like RNA helicase/predicted RNA-binding protein with RPS1 domain